MEEIKDSEKSCCSTTDKHGSGCCKCCCCKKKFIKIIVMIIAILIIFSAGVGVGRRAGGFEGRGGRSNRFGWNQEGQNYGCNMRGNQIGGQPIIDKNPTTATSAPVVAPIKK